MQIDSVIANTKNRVAWSVQIDGAEYTASFSDWSVTHDAGASFASAQLDVAQPITLAHGRHTVTIYAGWNGGAELVIKGEISVTRRVLWKPGQTFSVSGFARRCQDRILPAYDPASSTPLSAPGFSYATTDATWAIAQDDATQGYTAVDMRATPTDAAIIQHILQQYGIFPSTTGYNIVASPRVVAALDPIRWDQGTPGWSIITRLDTISPNYRTADGRSGAVLRRQIFGTVPSSVRHTFHQGVDVLGLEMTEDITPVVNEVLVSGAQDVSTNEQVQSLIPGSGPTTNVYIPSPPGTRVDESINDPFVETVSEAEAIGGDLLGRLSQPLDTYTLTTFGCPDLDVGDAIGIASDIYTGNAFVVAHTISASGQAPYLQSVLTVRGSTSADSHTNQPPVAQMTISVVQEQVYVGSAPAPLAMITVDATPSSDPDGTIASWSITLDGQTSTGTDITQAIITHATTSASPIDVTVTVTDNGGLSASSTQAATWDASTAIIEPLTLAEATQGEASLDGEQTWQSYAASVTAVAPIALGGVTCYGCSDGKLYRSIDGLTTAPTLATTLPATVNCLWNNEKQTDRWLAGLQNGDVWLSVDAAQTWVKLATLTAAITDLSESPYATNQMTAAAGSSIWQTFNGTTWAALFSHTATLLRFASGLYAGVSVTYAAGSDGKLLRWTDQTGSASVIASLSAGAAKGLTLDTQQELAYVFTDQTTANAYTLTPTGTLTSGAAIGTATNRAIRSGSGKWIYVASDGALVKWLPSGSAYDVRRMTSPQRCLAVGYGSAGQPVAPPVTVAGSFLLWPSGAGGADDKLWVWNGTTWVGTTPPRSSWHWAGAVANPFNNQEWLLWGTASGGTAYRKSAPDLKLYGDGASDGSSGTYSPLWRTSDGGSTWSEITLNLDSSLASTGQGGLFINSPMIGNWSDDATHSGTWMFATWVDRTDSQSRSYLYRGTHGAVDGMLLSTGVNYKSVVPATNNQWLHVGESALTDHLINGSHHDATVLQVITSSYDGSWHTATLADTSGQGSLYGFAWFYSVERLPASRAVLFHYIPYDHGYSNSPYTLLRTADYAGTAYGQGAPQGSVNTSGPFFAAATHGIYIASAEGLRRLTTLPGIGGGGSGQPPLVSAVSGSSVGYVRVGRKNRQLTAAVVDGGLVVSSDGSTWATIPFPGGYAGSFVEVIE